MDKKIIYLGAQNLCFDRKNPRMVEYNFTDDTSEEVIINTFWIEMAIEELILSILAYGFFQHEPLYVVREGGNLVVVEGNRRLAAIKAILNPSIIENGRMEKYQHKIGEAILNQLSNHIPVLELDSREEAWRYIGFKHINGAAKWGSYAKAKYIATVKKDFGMSLDAIAEQIGDANNTVRKLYQGWLVMEQADTQTSFKKEDTYARRIYFSHLYTAITYENFRNYLELAPDFCDENPVRQENLDKLEQLMFWLYGSCSKNMQPVLKTQNPDLRKLNDVLASKEALEYLKINNNLAIAHDVCKGGNAVLYQAIVKAKIALEKAVSKIGEYDGSVESLKVAKDVADTADSLFEQMDTIRKAKQNPKKERSIE